MVSKSLFNALAAWIIVFSLLAAPAAPARAQEPDPPRPAAGLYAATGALSATAAQVAASTGLVLWEQPRNSNAGSRSQDFESTYNDYDVYAADDFQNTVPWDISTITVYGLLSYINLANASMLHWYIYPDAGGRPSGRPGDDTSHWTISLPPGNPQVSADMNAVLNLATPLHLPPGHWWVFFYPSLNVSSDNEWYWNGSFTEWGGTAVQCNPGGAWGQGTACVNYGVVSSLAFRLEGTPYHPDLVLGKSDGGISAAPGDLITYTLSYTNTGPQAASGVVLTETVPLGSTFIPAASAPGWSCTPDASAGSRCIIPIGGGLAAGSSDSLTFTVQVDSLVAAGASQLSNTAVLGDDGANGSDLFPTDNTASDTTPLDVPVDLRLGLLAHPSALFPGDPLTYTLSVTNAGSQFATSGLISVTLPLSFSLGGQSYTPGVVPAGTGAWQLPTLAPGATSQITLTGSVAPGAAGGSPFEARAEVSSAQAEIAPADNHASAATILYAAPQVELGAAPAGSVEGAPLTFHGSYRIINRFPESLPPPAAGAGGLSAAWSFGDGTRAAGVLSAGAITTTHTYADNGIFTVTLTVTSTNGLSSRVAQPVSVANAAPQVSAGQDGTIVAGLPFSFQGSFSDPGSADTHTIAWSFGDGGTASTLAPRHTYTRPGDYTAMLTVTDDDGASTSASVLIHVLASLYLPVVQQ